MTLTANSGACGGTIQCAWSTTGRVTGTHADHSTGRFHHVSLGYTLGVGADGDVKAVKQ